MIILMLFSQCFYNKCYVAIIIGLFGPIIDIIFLPTFKNLPPRFCYKFFVKVLCIEFYKKNKNKMFQNLAPSFKSK